MNILSQIVESKRIEIKALYEKFDLNTLKNGLGTYKGSNSKPLFYERLESARANKQPFFFTEFKRKSPSEGWINQHADLPAQINAYIQAGAGAISVLTDEPFFGGTYQDLQHARAVLEQKSSTGNIPLILQKDFILDPIQIYLAKKYGADLILLIAAILEPEQLEYLRQIAESIGLGVLVEVHDMEELEQIQSLEFPVLGINNRDLKRFRTSLNRVNVLKKHANGRMIIAESGILNPQHFQMVRGADGFLIGTGLMRPEHPIPDFRLTSHFRTKGHFLFKACGIRTKEALTEATSPDFIGINFSPVSKRRADLATLETFKRLAPPNAVAVFYKNSEAEIHETLLEYPFRTAQFYAGDVSPEFVKSLKIRVLLAVPKEDHMDWSETIRTFVEPFASDIDCFILDGSNPGSGERIGATIPRDFPYPFLLAGGIQESNLDAILNYPNCIGVDIASGIETNGPVDLEKMKHIAQCLQALSLPHEL